MSHASNSPSERLRELLAGRALGDLSRDEEHELQSLLAAHSTVDADEFDRVAAALLLTMQPASREELPRHLSERIAAEARRHLPVAPVTSSSTRQAVTPSVAPSSTFGRRELFAWFAAAACLLLALTLWWGPLSESNTSLSPFTLRERLIEDAPDLVRVKWQAGKTPVDPPVSGDVVWSNARQEGYLHFHGLPKNDATREQYQLWIIDPQRDDEPIDGGVFDISSTGDVVIPISPKLKVLSPKAFAITIEKPGGVVVSTQERLPVLAVVEG